jgi:predicted acetyltransferase
MNENILKNPYGVYFSPTHPNTLQWMDILHPTHKTPIGFLIIGTGCGCPPDADYYVSEAYIETEYRNQGIMTEFFTEYLKENPGRYSLYIIKENKDAYRFWNGVFNSEGYKEENREDNKEDNEDVEAEFKDESVWVGEDETFKRYVFTNHFVDSNKKA